MSQPTGPSPVVRRLGLVDHSRERSSLKRGGDRRRVTLTRDFEARPVDADQILTIDLALRRLEARFLGGLSVEEAAEYLGVSPTSVKRSWRMSLRVPPMGASMVIGAGRVTYARGWVDRLRS